MKNGTLYRIAAFADGHTGGNPAGVWVGDQLPDSQTMQQIAAEVGYSETSFVSPETGLDRTVRYYSPEAEVPFCGHATIATGVILGRTSGDNTYRLATPVGEVPVTVESENGQAEASLVSVEPKQASASDALVTAALELLGWDKGDLDTTIPPMIAYAGAWHLVLAAKETTRLAHLDYDFEKLKSLMLDHELTTLQLVWRERDDLFHSRNPFPVGGVVEDPATGAAAAALGGYLRDAGILKAPTTFMIRQGEAMGSPSRLTVEVPRRGGIIVTGSAIDI
jgi:PhzF family phenazine biosynthesis protein